MDSTFDELERRLDEALAARLPGGRAQLRMARTPRDARAVPEDRTAGVLLLIYPIRNAPHLLLTVRTDTMRRHRGQVSLPGGVVEPDETPQDAALREASEEVGLDRSLVRVVGGLTPLRMPHTGFVVHPFVATAPVRPDLRPAELEVARVLEVPFAHLMDPARLRVESRLIGENPCVVPYFDLEGEKVWGATAMILAELLWALGVEVSPPEVAAG